MYMYVYCIVPKQRDNTPNIFDEQSTNSNNRRTLFNNYIAKQRRMDF